MVASVNSSAVQVPAMIRESDGETLIWTSGGYRTAAELGISLSGPSAVTVESLAAGEDEVNNLQRVLPVGTDFNPVGPIATPAGPMPNSSVVLGLTGGENDLLEGISFVIRDPARAAVYLEDGTDADVISGVAGTLPTAVTSTITLTTAVPLINQLTENQLMDCLLWVTYIPKNASGTSAGRAIKFMKRITAHAAFAAGTSTFTATVSGELLAGASGGITGWGVRPANAAWEVCAPNQSGARLPLHIQSKKASGYRLSVDSGVFAMPTGGFTW